MSAGDTVEVKDGYGRNYPAAPRPGDRRHAGAPSARPTTIRRAREIKTVRGLEHANELKTALEGLGAVSLPVRTASDSGKLFGSVTAADVVAAIKKAGGPNLDKRTVQLPKGAHQDPRHPPGRGAAAPRRGRRGVSQRRRRVRKRTAFNSARREGLDRPSRRPLLYCWRTVISAHIPPAKLTCC